MGKILIEIILVGMLVITGCGVTESEIGTLCKNDCFNDGWNHGEHAGHGFCNCYNVTSNNIEINNSEINTLGLIIGNPKLEMTAPINYSKPKIVMDFNGTEGMLWWNGTHFDFEGNLTTSAELFIREIMRYEICGVRER